MDHKLILTPHKYLFTKYIITIIYFISISHHNARLITSCKQTPYPTVCHRHVSTSPLKTTFLYDKTNDGLTFHNLVVTTTMDQAVQLHRLVSAVAQRGGSLHKHATSALHDCLDLYEDTIHNLNHSRRSYGQESSAHDRLTSLSAAIANQDTCKNGFKDFNLTSTYSKYFPIHIHRNLTKSISNSLAVTKSAAKTVAEKAFTKFNKQKSTRHGGGGGGGRRLMSSDEKFPSWISLFDRKLLEDSETTVKSDIVVAKDGSGRYKSIQEAVNAGAKLRRRNKRLVIYVKAGVYRENVEIKKSIKNVMIIGDGIDSTIVTGNKNVRDGTTTFRSATFAVSGPGFIARDITFENTAGPAKHQAVALRSGSDFAVFYGCSFKGYQDTLYLHSRRQFLRNCHVHGTVDMIFGDAAALLQNCQINALKPMTGQKNTVTAQSRKDPNENTGFVIQTSTVSTASETYLGRPWKSYSRTVFMRCNLGELVNPKGWLPWNGSFGLNTLYYGEYGNTGAGASLAGRVKWPGYRVLKTAKEAEKFTVENFLDGNYWITDAGVPVNP
ncbi:unnamed protein product [Cochlearia groenlandica]